MRMKKRVFIPGIACSDLLGVTFWIFRGTVETRQERERPSWESSPSRCRAGWPRLGTEREISGSIWRTSVIGWTGFRFCYFQIIVGLDFFLSASIFKKWQIVELRIIIAIIARSFAFAGRRTIVTSSLLSQFLWQRFSSSKSWGAEVASSRGCFWPADSSPRSSTSSSADRSMPFSLETQSLARRLGIR